MLNKRIQKNISHLLCFVMFWISVIPVCAADPVLGSDINESEILARYPDAKIIHVEPADYPQLAEQLRIQGYEATIPVTHIASNESIQANGSVLIQKNVPLSDDCNSRSGSVSTPGDDSLRVMVDFSSDMMKSTGNNNGDGAAIVFVIIGTVLIVVWALYVFKYLYDVATGFTPCGKWSDLIFTSSSISGNGNQHARFNGVRYMTGFRDGATEFGISAELGHSDILLDEVNTPELKGLYWFIGPVLRWRLSTSKNPHYFQMNFLAGSTEHDEMGVIAQANLGLQFGIGEAMRLGLSWGAMNINLNNDQGIISDDEQYYYLYGFSMGYRF